MQTTQLSPTTQTGDMRKLREWTEGLFKSAESLPISFTYGGQPIQGIPADWQPHAIRQRVDANIITTTFTGKHPGNEMEIRVEIQEYLDFPVIEWTAWFSNPGDKTSRLLSDVLAIDCDFKGDHPVLTHCNGDFYHAVPVIQAKRRYSPPERLCDLPPLAGDPATRRSLITALFSRTAG